MKVLFKDLEVQRLLDDYQQLIGIRIAVFDTDYHELYSSPKSISSFCDLIRRDNTVHATCTQCDRKGFLMAQEKKDTYLYKCHMNLYEAITPLYDHEQILGYVMIGQVLDQNPVDLQWNLLKGRYRAHLPLLTEAKKAFYELRQMSDDDINACSRIMKACAISIWLSHIIDIERSPITERINYYVRTHLKETISTQSLCDALHISKSTVFNYLKKEHNLSLTAFINQIRLEHAKYDIEKTGKTLTSIAIEYGFTDYTYFAKLFKKAYHVTPKQYRNLHLNPVEA